MKTLHSYEAISGQLGGIKEKKMGSLELNLFTGVETIYHVLCEGEMARKVWDYFAAVFAIRLPQLRTWQGVVNVWWLQASRTSQVQCFSRLSSRDERILTELNCPIAPITVKLPPKAIAWTRPSRGLLKLNVDDGSNGNLGPSGGGGIIPDNRGCASAGFAHYYGTSTNSFVEGRPLLDGLRLVQQLDVRNLVVVEWITS
ncbi:hypothetical protein F2P56_006866, partial [Juglans regia]